MKVFALGFFLVFMSLDQSQASSLSCKSFLNKENSQDTAKRSEQSKFGLGLFTKIFGRKKTEDKDASRDGGSVSPDAEVVALKDVQAELGHILVSGLHSVDLIDSAIVKVLEALSYIDPEIASYSTKKTALAAAAEASKSVVIYFEDLTGLEQAYVNLRTLKRNSNETTGFNLNQFREHTFSLFSQNQQIDLNELIKDLQDLKDQFLVINLRVEVELDSINAQLAETL